MDILFYWSVVLVGGILAVKYGWKALKFAFKVWYNFFAILIVGVLFFVYVFPLLLKMFLY